MEDTAVLEQLKLINELDTEEKNILLKLIETFVSKKRFKIIYRKILLRYNTKKPRKMRGFFFIFEGFI